MPKRPSLAAAALLLAAGFSAGAQAPGDWKPVRSGEIKLDGEIVASPILVGGRIFVATRSGGLFGFEASDGTLAWSRRTPGPIRELAAASGLAVVVDPAGLLTAWDAEGNAVWSAAIGAEPALPSMGSKGLFLAAGTDGSLTAFSTSDGARIWSLSLASGPARGLAATDTAAFVAGADSSLFVLDGRGQTGAAVPEGLQADALVLDGDRLFVGRPDGRLECMTTAPFKALWTRRLGAPLAAEPLSDGRRVFAVVRSGVVFALDRRSGDSLWWRPLPSTSVFRPLLWNGAVVVAARSNLILAFDPVTGKPLGRFDAGLIVRAQPIITAAGLWLPVYDQERDRSAILILKIAGGSAPVTTRSGGKQP